MGIVFAALDELDTFLQTSNQLYLRAVDKFNDFLVSAYITHSGIKFLLLHKQNRQEEAIKGFFEELHEVWIKHVLLNPFYEPFQWVDGDMKGLLDARVSRIAGRWFNVT